MTPRLKLLVAILIGVQFTIFWLLAAIGLDKKPIKAGTCPQAVFMHGGSAIAAGKCKCDSNL